MTGQFLLVLVTTAMFGLAFSGYFLLPKFLAVELDADAASIGGLSAVTMLASVVFMPIVGVQVDRRSRKLFGTAGAAIFAVASIGFLFVDSIGPLIWLLRTAHGAAFTLFYIALSTLTTDLAPARRLGQAIGLFGGVMIATNALGPALAEWLAREFSWTVVFAASAASATLATVLSLLVREPAHAPSDDAPTGMLALIARPGLKRILLVAVLTGLAMGALFTFYQPWALELGYEHVSAYLIAFAGTAMVMRLGFGGLADRHGRLRVATVSLSLYVTAPLAVIWIDVFGLVICGALLGLAHGLFFPALNTVAVDYAAARERGKAMAAYHGSFNIGFGGGSYLLGYLAEATSYPVIFAVAAASCFTAFLLLLAPRRSPRCGTLTRRFRTPFVRATAGRSGCRTRRVPRCG